MPLRATKFGDRGFAFVGQLCVMLPHASHPSLLVAKYVCTQTFRIFDASGVNCGVWCGGSRVRRDEQHDRGWHEEMIAPIHCIARALALLKSRLLR